MSADELHTVTISERGSVIYTGQSMGQLAAMMLASVTCMMQGVFAQPTVISEGEGLTELNMTSGGRTLHILIESASRITARQADDIAFGDITAGFDSGSAAAE